jgi:hypothetical protein
MEQWLNGDWQGKTRGTRSKAYFNPLKMNGRLLYLKT